MIIIPSFNHPAITVGMEAESYSVSEAEGVLSVCAVIINGQTERDVSVEFSISQMPDTTAEGSQLCCNLQSGTQLMCTQKPLFSSDNSLLLYVLPFISTAQTDFELNPMTAQHMFQPETANQSQCINITIRSDVALEDDESFFVVLDSSEPRIILNPNTSVVTILDSNSKLVLHKESPCMPLTNLVSLT